MIRFILPLGIFLLLALFLALGLKLDPREVPSPLIDKPAPAFAAPALARPNEQIQRDALLGQVWLLNVWASWCVACRDEHPLLVEFSKKKLVPIYGLNYKDQRADALGWLGQFGNPYTDSVFDGDGRIDIQTLSFLSNGSILSRSTSGVTGPMCYRRIRPWRSITKVSGTP